MNKKLCYTLFQSFLPNEYSGDIDNAIGITWYWCLYQQYQMTEKVMLHLILIIMNQEMQWWYWWCPQGHVIPILASHDLKHHVTPCFNHFGLTNKMCYWKCYQCHLMLALVPTALHGQKSHVTLCFNCFHIINTILQLMMHLISHDSIAVTNGTTSPHFDDCDWMNAMVLLSTPLASQRYVQTLLEIGKIHKGISNHYIDTFRHYDKLCHLSPMLPVIIGHTHLFQDNLFT